MSIVDADMHLMIFHPDYNAENAGLDFLMGSIFKLGLTAGYHLLGDFERPIGSETNYSGPEYSLIFGFVF